MCDFRTAGDVDAAVFLRLVGHLCGGSEELEPYPDDTSDVQRRGGAEAMGLGTLGGRCALRRAVTRHQPEALWSRKV